MEDHEIYWNDKSKIWARAGWYADMAKKWGKNDLWEDAHWIGDMIVKYKPTSLLDVGCGSGRLFQLWNGLGIKDVEGIEYSKLIFDSVKQNEFNVKVHNMSIIDQSVPRKFDMVFNTQVLLHIPPQHIEKTFANMIKMSNKYLAMIVWYEVKRINKDKASSYKKYGNSFSHDYPALFKQFNLKVIEESNITFFNKRKNVAWLVEICP